MFTTFVNFSLDSLLYIFYFFIFLKQTLEFVIICPLLMGMFSLYIATTSLTPPKCYIIINLKHPAQIQVFFIVLKIILIGLLELGGKVHTLHSFVYLFFKEGVIIITLKKSKSNKVINFLKGYLRVNFL